MLKPVTIESDRQDAAQHIDRATLEALVKGAEADRMAIASAGATMTANDVAAIVGRTPWVVRKWIRAGALATVSSDAGQYLITREALLNFLFGSDAA